MPGLVRGVARTAVIAGTATHVSNNVSRRQNEKWQRQEMEQQQAAPVAAAPVAAAPAAPSEDDKLDQLQKLGELKSQGILTDEEFAAQKAKLLA